MPSLNGDCPPPHRATRQLDLLMFLLCSCRYGDPSHPRHAALYPDRGAAGLEPDRNLRLSQISPSPRP